MFRRSRRDAAQSYDNARIISSFKALADETRFDVLHCICAGPRFGLELANIMGVTASAVSYHVNKLIEHGFVESTLIKERFISSLALIILKRCGIHLWRF